MEECMTFDILMEDLSSIVNEYLYDVILEDINTESDAEKTERKDGIVKRFFGMIVKILKFIGQKISKFVKKVAAYLGTLKSEKCVVMKDCEVSSEIITGVQGATFSSIYYIAKQIGKGEKHGDDMSVYDDSIDKIFESEKKTLKAGLVLQYNILQRNLLNIQSDHDKVTNKIEGIEKTITTRDNIPRAYFNKVQEILKKYQSYLSRILNEMGDFIKNKVSVIVAKKSDVKQEIVDQDKLKDGDTFKPSKTLNDAIDKNDILSIKSCLVYIIKTDPTFKTNNFNNAVDYVESKGITIKEPYKLMPDEEIIEDKSKWTEKYFYYAANMLEENFALSRIPHIKAVGKFVFK